MSKIIKLTSDYIEECRAGFEKALQDARLCDGKISFAKTLSPRQKRNATIYFTTEAWTKMVILLQEFSKEVAWHGVAYRNDAENDEYIITDILVYPQEVTGATVEMDTEQYASWLQENDEDERFYNIRMQGHSHVNMAPTPSSVDMSHQENILAQLGDDDFYIFMICNKSFQRNIKIYDMRKNILFENADIEVKLCDAAVSFDEFLRNARKIVKDKVPVPSLCQSGVKADLSHSLPAATTPLTKPKAQIGAGWHGGDLSNTPHGYDYDDEIYNPYQTIGGKY